MFYDVLLNEDNHSWAVSKCGDGYFFLMHACHVCRMSCVVYGYPWMSIFTHTCVFFEIMVSTKHEYELVFV